MGSLSEEVRTEVLCGRICDLESENTKLRHDLEEANNQAEEVCTENAKLRELVRRFCEYVSQDRCEGCVMKLRCNEGLIEECWQRSDIRTLASELGIEVPNE